MGFVSKVHHLPQVKRSSSHRSVCPKTCFSGVSLMISSWDFSGDNIKFPFWERHAPMQALFTICIQCCTPLPRRLSQRLRLMTSAVSHHLASSSLLPSQKAHFLTEQNKQAWGGLLLVPWSLGLTGGVPFFLGQKSGLSLAKKKATNASRESLSVRSQKVKGPDEIDPFFAALLFPSFPLSRFHHPIRDQENSPI